MNMKGFGFLLLLFLGLGSAQATVYTDLFDGQGEQVGGGQEWFEKDWLFDIGQHGFDSTTEKITSATIEFNLTDSTDDYGNWFWGYEFALASTEDEYLGFWEVDTGGPAFDLNSYTSLNRKGTLEVALFGLFNEFSIDSALLTVHAETVPEPGIVGLFAIGLILFGIGGRLRAMRTRSR